LLRGLNISVGVELTTALGVQSTYGSDALARSHLVLSSFRSSVAENDPRSQTKTHKESWVLA
jgi:hypothetical protein